jgi:hypothetical protein
MNIFLEHPIANSVILFVQLPSFPSYFSDDVSCE